MPRLITCSCCSACRRRARNCSDWELEQLVKRCSIDFSSYHELLATFDTQHQILSATELSVSEIVVIWNAMSQHTIIICYR